MRKRRILGVGCLLVALGLVVMVGTYFVYRYQTRRELGEIFAALDESDPGWRLDSLERDRATVPPEENSGPHILKIQAQIPAKWHEEDPEAHWRELWPNEPLSPREAALLEPRMAKVDGLVVEARRLVDRPRGHFPIAWSNDAVSTLVPHVQRVRDVADLLYHDAVWQTHHGKLETALGSCRAILNVARSIDSEPLLISQLVRAACLRMALQALHRTLAAGEAEAASLLAVQQTLTEMDRHDSLVTGMRGERAGMHLLCTNLENGTVQTRTLLSIMGTRAGPTVVDRAEEFAIAATVPASHIWLMRHFSDVIEATKLPAAEQAVRMKELHRDPIQAPLMAKFMAPGWIKCHETFQRDRAHLRCAIVALAIERYRLKHGQCPNDLAALTPDFLAAIPADPFTDAPLQYRQAPTGIAIYSVGPSGALQGTFYDDRRPANPGAAVSRDGEFEFRLWDVDSRNR